MSPILVTGGSGFIGSHLCRTLLAHGYSVANFDKRPPADEMRKMWIEGDLLSPSSVADAVSRSRPDTVIHLAAHAEIQSKSLDAFASIHEGTRNLLNALESIGTVTKFVNTSTQLVVRPGKAPSSETDFDPYTHYGEAKMIAERELRERDPPFQWTTVRPAIIWGPGHPHFANSIWRYLRKRYYLHPKTDRPVLRTYGYVSNTALQYLAVVRARREAVDRRIFYLADKAIDSSEWIDGFARSLTGSPSRRASAPVLRVLARAGDLASILGLPAPLDSERLMRMTTDYVVPLQPILALAGPPLFTLEQGIAATVAWLRETRPELYGSTDDE